MQASCTTFRRRRPFHSRIMEPPANPLGTLNLCVECRRGESGAMANSPGSRFFLAFKNEYQPSGATGFHPSRLPVVAPSARPEWCATGTICRIQASWLI
jgi:hypothetical protein